MDIPSAISEEDSTEKKKKVVELQKHQHSSSLHKCEKVVKEYVPYMSQMGEDAQIHQFFNYLCNGTYIEMGALDGKKYSNTYKLHKKFHWKGILIELSPTNYNGLIENRKDEIATINTAVCKERKTLHFYNSPYRPATSGIYEFTTPTFHERWWNGATLSSPNMKEIECLPMKDILSDYKDIIQFFDMFSLDVEGAEYEVLNSIDFDEVAFGIIFVEADQHNEAKNEKARFLLEQHGYTHFMNFAKSDWFYNNDFVTIYEDILDPMPAFIQQLDEA